MATATASEAKALGYNLQVDYVIHYSFGNGGKCRTVAGVGNWGIGAVLRVPTRPTASN